MDNVQGEEYSEETRHEFLLQQKQGVQCRHFREREV